MTIKERLHQLVEKLPEEQAGEWIRRIETEQPLILSDEENNFEDNTLSAEEPLTGMEGLLALAEDIVNKAPEEERNQGPVDASLNLDHYLYGSPKQRAVDTEGRHSQTEETRGSQ